MSYVTMRAPHPIKVWSPSEVTDATSFCHYAQQRLGTGDGWKEIASLTRDAQEFFAKTPGANWLTLVHTVEYIRSVRRRVATPAGVVSLVPYALRDGFLPEMDRRIKPIEDAHVESEIEYILAHETDPWWVRAFTCVKGVDERRNLVRMYHNRERDD